MNSEIETESQVDTVPEQNSNCNDASDDSSDGCPSRKKPRISDSGNNGQQCPICLEEWTTAGEHRLCCLKCGHLYGLSCLNRWLSSQPNKTCPTCKQKVARNDIRHLYATKLIAIDNSEVFELKKKLEAKTKSQNKIQIDYTRCLYSISLLTEQNKLLKQELAVAKATSGSTEVSASNTTVKLYKDKSIKICNEGACRVMASYPNIDLVAVSTKSENPLFPGFGMRKIDVNSYKFSGFIPLHSQPIRDAKFHQQNPWLLTVSLDKTFKIVDCGSHSTIKSLSYNSPLWSCCWHATEEHLFYVGEQEGSVSKFDMRQMSTPITKLVVENNWSPVVSLASVENQDTNINQGVMVCKLDSLWYFEHTDSNYNMNDLPVEGAFVSMAYDNTAKQILVSFRPNNRNIYTSHILGHLIKQQGILTFNPIHNIQGFSTTQRLLSRSCFVADKTQYIAAYQESANTVQLWNVNTGDKAFSLLSKDSVIDLCGYQANYGNYLIALTEKKLEFFKFA